MIAAGNACMRSAGTNCARLDYRRRAASRAIPRAVAPKGEFEMAVSIRRVRCLAALASLLGCWNAWGVPVVPGGFATVEGDSNNVIPFTNGFGSFYQQIYDAAAFAGASGAISSVAFRLDFDQPAGIPIEGRANLSVRLGSSARSSQTVSTAFEANRAGEPVEVFNGVLNFSLTDLPGSGPNPFDLRIDFERPFFFDGLQNLLLELTLLEPLVVNDPSGITLDAATGPFGRAFDSPIGNLSTPSFGLITQFDIAPASIPEPAPIILFLLGLALVVPLRQQGLEGRRKRQ
jgi:hypothetical protein